MLDYSKWLQRAEEFVRSLDYSSRRWAMSISVEPRLSHARADEIHHNLPCGLPRSLREAGLALRLQKTLLPGSSACEYPKLGIFRMLAAIPDLAEVETFVQEWLGSLLDYDARRKAELVHTLTQYLEHGGNYDATAAKLSVHKSTLKYRLQRIRELTGLELNDPDVHFNLQLATRAWGTLQALDER